MTIVVHASDCKAIQCKPIEKQSALIVAIRPAQRNMSARLITALFDVNQRYNADSQPSRTTIDLRGAPKLSLSSSRVLAHKRSPVRRYKRLSQELQDKSTTRRSDLTRLPAQATAQDSSRRHTPGQQ